MTISIVGNCCCDVVAECVNCITNTVPSSVKVTFVNVANGTCVDATNLNGTWELDRVEDCNYLLTRGDPNAAGFPCDAAELDSIAATIEIFGGNMVWKISVFDDDVEIFITFWNSEDNIAIDCSDTQTNWSFDQEAGSSDPIDFSNARTELELDPQ